IQSAKYDRLVMIDADCQPNGPQWLRIMAQQLSGDVQLVLGYGPYAMGMSWLHRLLRFETLYIAIQYFSFARLGVPYMGVGRNLAYRRTLFAQQNGFYNHQHIASGDDDLFVSAAANRQNTAWVMDPRAFTYSVPVESWQAYYYQKTRHLSTSWSYRPLHRGLLALLSASQVGHHLFSVILLLSGTMPWLVCTLYLVRLLVVIGRIRAWMRHLDSPLSWWQIPALDIWLSVLHVWLAPSMLTDKRVPWKP
ncbi:MAG: glycosyltransferase, partial [Bacteroidota bacterium]